MNAKLFSFDKVYEKDGFLYVKARNLRPKSGELRVLFANEENITLVEQHNNSIYNYFLISEKEPRVIQLQADKERKAGGKLNSYIHKPFNKGFFSFSRKKAKSQTSFHLVKNGLNSRPD
ncbi:hypothetical protein [Cecembia calidifontis]|uniref:Uncharacterized protein n=1 Tax=Cecembia calidifontis TaxID=1187080 RepID=A0A4Q7P9B5_9BACT|nr:hypothetical protein [Cecembia calidifontis]RZS96168.1 hypothetical protein BC751_1731 [Cecembia calidifontis]